jgi:hypothetical protein
MSDNYDDDGVVSYDIETPFIEPKQTDKSVKATVLDDSDIDGEFIKLAKEYLTNRETYEVIQTEFKKVQAALQVQQKALSEVNKRVLGLLPENKSIFNKLIRIDDKLVMFERVVQGVPVTIRVIDLTNVISGAFGSENSKAVSKES